MGGHSAWRKRVAEGGLAKEGTGGAIARHRPRWGRKGKDLKLNRKGNIGGGNPKKTNKANSRNASAIATPAATTAGTNGTSRPVPGGSMTRRDVPSVKETLTKIVSRWVFVMISGFIYMYLKNRWTPKESEFPGL
jgi:hypothetical protein